MGLLGGTALRLSAGRIVYPDSDLRRGGIETTAGRACPECGGRMDRGFLVAESYLGGAKWVTRRTRMAAGGASLVRPDNWGNVFLAGQRCPGCRLLVLRY